MQGVDGIIKTILDEAELDARATAEQNEQYIEALKKKAETEVAAMRKAQLDSAMEKGFESERRAMTMMDVKKRRDDLAVRRNLVDEAFRKAIEAVNQLDKDAYKQFIVSLLVEAAETGEEEVITAPGDTRIDKKVIDEANAKLAAAGKTGKLGLSDEKRDMNGGFVLKRGGVETNCSLEMLVDQQHAQLEKDVAEALFGA